MFKKTVAFIVSVILSLVPVTLMAGQYQKGSKKWDPSEKPQAQQEQVQQQQQTQQVQQNQQMQQEPKAGQKIQLHEQRKIQERVGPGPVA